MFGVWGRLRKSGKKQKRQRSRSERGQASLLIALMMTTFLILFTFVVNTGTLVNAKINLQNAADLAAYAGAATQARQLNHLGFLNFEMRRQWKKFLFRYLVVGTLAQKSFQGGGGLRKYSPDGNLDFKVPVICVVFFARDNFCQVATLGGIRVPATSALDAIATTLHNQLKQIEQLRQASCESIGKTNFLLASLWLFNTSPLVQFASLAASTPQTGNAGALVATIRGLASGLGIIPRLAILKSRVKTLEYYLNFPAQNGVNLEAAQALKSQGDIAARERTIQAFFSAYNTLSNHIFPTESIRMDELLPIGSDGANLLKLIPVTTNFDVYAEDFELRENTENGEGSKDCIPRPVVIPIQGQVPVGFRKDMSVKTYYALRLEAQANTLFNPFGNSVTMRAYAAARPFGSRIGPIDGSDPTLVYKKEGTADGICGAGGGSGQNNIFGNKCAGGYPTLGNDAAVNWHDLGFQRLLFDKMRANTGASAGAGGSSSGITAEAMVKTYQEAMFPAQNEAGKFMIPIDTGGCSDPKNSADVDCFFENASGTYGFWAPVFSSDKLVGGDDAVKAEISALITESISGAEGGNAGSGASGLAGATAALRAMQTELVDSLTRYIEGMRTGTGTEDSEGFNIARIRNPFKGIPINGNPPGPINLPPPFGVDPSAARTSWNDTTSALNKALGRTGYSVKIVSFKSLREDSPANPPELDSKSDLDLQRIEH